MMKSFLSALLFSGLLLSFTGCPSPPQDAVSDADQSAIEAYQEAEAAEQAQMSEEMNEAAPQ